MTDDDERETLPPGPCDDACHEFETLVQERGEYETRLQYLSKLVVLFPRDP